jgi:hypothetical protein
MLSGSVQPCTFKVDYTLPIAPGMEFGSVFIGDQPENLAVTVVAAGWARVSTAAFALCHVNCGPSLLHGSDLVHDGGCLGLLVCLKYRYPCWYTQHRNRKPGTSIVKACTS